MSEYLHPSTNQLPPKGPKGKGIYMSSEQFLRDNFTMRAEYNKKDINKPVDIESDAMFNKQMHKAAKKALALCTLASILLTAGCSAEKDKAPYEKDRITEIGSLLINDDAEIRTDPFRGDNENPTFLLTPEVEETIELSNGAYVDINAASGKIYIGTEAENTNLDSKKDKDGIVWGIYGDIVPFDKDGKRMSEDDLLIASSSLDKTSQETTEDWAN